MKTFVGVVGLVSALAMLGCASAPEEETTTASELTGSTSTAAGAREMELDLATLDQTRELTRSELAAMFDRGSNGRGLGRFWIAERRRNCTSATGCSDWRWDTETHLWTRRSFDYAIDLGRRVNQGWAWLEVNEYAGTIDFVTRLNASPGPFPGCRVPSGVCTLRFRPQLAECRGSLCTQAPFMVVSAENKAISFPIRVTKDFYYAKAGTYRESLSGPERIEYLLYGRTNPNEVAELSVDDGKLVARW